MINRMILNELAYFGKGASKEILPIIEKNNFKKILVVTQKELLDLGVASKVTDLLDEAAISYSVFANVQENPTVKNVKEGVSACKEYGADAIVAVGGGSAIDTAKAIGIIITNPEFEDVVSLEGAETKNKALPIIAVSTTSGTAAEVTINYVITDEEKQRKFVCVDPNDLPIAAIIDTEMVKTMPKSLAAYTGMDALTHAIEGYITKGAWGLPDALHLYAIELISKNLRASVLEADEKAREEMALAQYVAGMGFSNVGLGIVHSMAHPLGAVYGIAHGAANAVLLPYVMEFNAEATGERYRDIARAMGVRGTEEMSQAEYRYAAINAVKQLSMDLSIPEKVSSLGVKEEDIEKLAAYAMADACTPGNPREATKEEIVEIYKKAF
ncbi:lactaldehyde reductase [Jeotgalibaca caeni]|uniref:lactaldehyde reductase n=1 Tax=Jeotgalibaca caeni TaxID=3028623 RepID=UPI00237DCBED|nr:lactaldehyde reductase [Jeotgalibaca caeni]MDE1550027.1 lactaldehyde reductase [Jeotgalibaca caeni]